ncbi:TPGS1-like protein [Mya arenaria]|uniref:TPGS1-like protein n=1 Tax=Mya arenaria TaxID=6604 RepID=A0ABY7ELU9_MYAAR|nr:TPGS1-like protein [Mya arenaria]
MTDRNKKINATEETTKDFDSIEDGASLVQKADQVLKMTHYSRPLFESNVRIAYDILAAHKVAKKVYGVNGVVFMDLLTALSSVVNMRPYIMMCSSLEFLPAVCYKLAEQLFQSLDIHKAGKANKALCDVVVDQLNTALGSTRTDARRILESGYNLGVDGLYLALERAMSRSQRNASLETNEQFVTEICDAFLCKVKKFG